MPPKVVMRKVEDRVVIESSGGLGGHFDAYRRACSGARFDGQSKTWNADPEMAMRISGKLNEAGFTVILTAEVRALLEGEVATRPREWNPRKSDSRRSTRDCVRRAARCSGFRSSASCGCRVGKGS